MLKTTISPWKIFTNGFVLSHSKLGIYGSGRPPPRHHGLPQRCHTILLHQFHGSYFKIISYIQLKKEIHCHQNSPLSRMSETEDFVSHKTKSISVPPSSRAASSAPSIIPGNSKNPICISDSDGDEDFIPPSAKELAERRRLRLGVNCAVKEEPKVNVLKSVPVKHEY